MIKFVKYQGTGNDFIIINKSSLSENINRKMLAKKVCDRKFGIGADGMIVIEESHIADMKMCFYNADGTIATMCGNGIRCFSKYIYSNKLVNKVDFTVETLAGIMKVNIIEEDEKIIGVRINLGKPLFTSDEIPKDTEDKYYINKELIVNGEKYIINVLKIGTIHTVIFDDELILSKIEKVGHAIENHKKFPMKTNVNFVKVIDKDNIEVITWEKGVGITLACGTGSAASAIFSKMLKGCNERINVKVLGGNLTIENIKGEIFMTGPAEFICEGMYNI